MDGSEDPVDHGTRDDLTALLDAARAGGEDAQDRLVRAVYGELRRMAAGFMRRERTDHTLQPSALAHEAVIRLLDGGALVKAQDRRHLFAAAARAMRQVLVDHARTRGAAKRAGGRGRVPLDDVLAYFEAQHLDVIALHEAIDRLIKRDERQGLVVALRFFAGLSIAEVAEALDVSAATVEGDWRVARAWLRGQLGGEAE
jgi:RNA polymerase sigma-70 factor, ECF subfamily